MEKQKVMLSCPKCFKVWAELSFQFEEPVMPEDIRIVEGDKINKEIISCACCGYNYTNWDIMLAIAAKGDIK